MRPRTASALLSEHTLFMSCLEQERKKDARHRVLELRLLGEPEFPDSARLKSQPLGLIDTNCGPYPQVFLLKLFI